MKKNRIKKTLAEPVPALITREDVEAAVTIIASCKAGIAGLNAQIDTRIAAIRQEHEDDLAALAEQVSIATDQLEQWAATHPDAFGKRKSIQCSNGRVGYRTGTPKLKTLAKRTWATVLETIRNSAAYKAYVRTKHEVDKDRILADREVLGDDGLKLLGLQVIQDETFFVEVELTETDPKETREA